ncbi:MAG TPA: hypothetical protein VFV33_25800 [Gemmatimonadaceae bacterium]|nr:hypothetical protein [Gemmatimonadaceae bacterium]
MPLAHCRTCDTYYPRSRGGCKWCGTKASAAPSFPIPVLIGLAVALVMAAGGYWWLRSSRDARDEVVAVSPSAPAQETGSPALVPSEGGVAPDAADSVRADTIPPGADTSGGAMPQPVQPVVSPTAPSTPPAQPPVAAGSTPNALPRATTPPPSPAIPTGPSSVDRFAGPWARGVAIEWVNVRGTPARDAAVVGVVTPNTRVLLGDVRAGWRRVRAPGFEGWADGRFFAPDSARR